MNRRPLPIVLAAIGLAACLLCLLVDPHALLVSYLAAAVSVSAIPIGALAVLMITYLVRGHWTEGLHVPLIAAALTLPVAGILFVPVLIGIPWLYPWAQAAAGESGSFKALYLTGWFFAARTVLYFVIWTALAVWVRRAWTDPARMIQAASAGLIVYALTASLAGVDWIESLTPEFHSSIYGLLFMTFQVLAGLAFALTVALWRPSAPTFRYGPILLSALLLWAYNHAMQYIIIWSANIPEETIWYVRRESGGWGVVLWGLIALQFILPFFAMLSERVRNERGPLLAVTALTLALRFVEALLLAAPGTVTDGALLLLAYPAAILVTGALWWMGFAAALRHVASTAHDLSPLGDAFDQAGSAAPRASG
jgi:hypothetical protein